MLRESTCPRDGLTSSNISMSKSASTTSGNAQGELNRLYAATQ
jgi:hypothetical protein